MNPNHRTVAISSLIAGYVLAAGFAVLLLTGSDSEEIVSDSSNIEEGEIVSAADVAVLKIQLSL